MAKEARTDVLVPFTSLIALIYMVISHYVCLSRVKGKWVK